MNRMYALAVALCLLAPLAGPAEAGKPGWYAGANLPIMYIDDTDTKTVATIQTPRSPIEHAATAGTEHETGFKLAGIVGYGFASGIRVEAEVFFARASIDKIDYSNIRVPAFGFTFPGKIPVPVSGSVDQYGGLLNVWYDYDTGLALKPYIGGGVGFLRVDQGDLKYDDNRLTQVVTDALSQAQGLAATALPPGYVPRPSSSDTVAAYHIGAGIGYELSERITLQAGYRLQRTGELSFPGRNETASTKATTDLQIHFFEIGIRYHF